eukprot:TRINITY_DN4977_c0_g1_i1.p1 TRINITY_DN4977_c0_g1~~TRINITY_DN4977_c0_g1_i1.p1  ORF type:complete len:286 (-),score=23.52 TRINITY_DN4977_c0_g1_i1:172-1029(-)
MNSALYVGSTTHARRRPSANRFTYGVYMIYVDLQEAQSGLLDCWPFFSTKTPFSLLSLLVRDHMINERPEKLYPTVCDLVERETGKRPTGPIRLLTNPRVCGVEFNPVSFYYVFEPDGTTLQCIVAEVGNFPWFEQHNYVVTPTPSASFNDSNKEFHVSPFIQMDNIAYHWVFNAPADSISVRIALSKQREQLFTASLDAQRRRWSVFNMIRMQLRYPLHSIRVMAAILYEAAKLFQRDFTFYAHPQGTQTKLSRAVEVLVGAVNSLRYSLQNPSSMFGMDSERT